MYARIRQLRKLYQLNFKKLIIRILFSVYDVAKIEFTQIRENTKNTAPKLHTIKF